MRKMHRLLTEHRGTMMVVVVVLMYFLWMDVALYYRIQSLTPANLKEHTASDRLFSPFTGLSVKMMMLDQVNNYIHTPLANMFNRVTNFSQVFYFITPNMVSFAGFLAACVAARFVAMDSLSMHRFAVLMFCLRTWFDALDGLVARERVHQVRFVSMRDTSGYVVDGVADAAGFTVFLIGCFCYLRRHVVNSIPYLPLTTATLSGSSTNISIDSKPQLVTQRRVFIVVFVFGLQLLVSSYFWDHYIAEYHELLEVEGPGKAPDAQSEVLRSSMMWIIMWFWRISNGHALMHIFLFFIYVDRMWDFLVWIQWIGAAIIATLVVFTEIHLQTVKAYLL